MSGGRRCLEFARLRLGFFHFNGYGSRVAENATFASVSAIQFEGANSARKKPGASRALDSCEQKTSGDQK
jgi:hypothetical protein